MWACSRVGHTLPVGTKYYAVSVAKGGSMAWIYKGYRRYAAAVGDVTAAPSGGRRGTHIAFEEGTRSHSFLTVRRADAWLEQEGWFQLYQTRIVHHW